MIVTIIIVIVIVGLAALILTFRLGLVLTRLVIGNHAEIVVSELKILLHQYAVAIMLRVLCQFLVLVEELRRIATCPAVDAIGAIAAALVTVIAAAATSIIAVVVQGITSCLEAPTRLKM